ncbi:ATP-binding protein [uncultured Pseudacidovorax sp.]|uniref:sensor histidine kinase n=1 Tax=uncultured Pseudacidovorax sp. TaxID=679313 RepID=UPI0025F5C6AA|nr:ATP-binding protein [uncultured Pseudacidovorax sp.]
MNLGTLSFRRRLAIVHFAVVTVVMAVVASVGTWAFSTDLRGDLDDAILALAELEAGMLATAEPGTPVVVHEAVRNRGPSYARVDRLVQVVNKDGKVVARSANMGAAMLPVAADLRAQIADGGPVYDELDRFASEPTRVVAVAVPHRPDLLAVQVAASLEDVNHAVASAGIMMLLLTVVLIVALGIAGELLTRRVFNAIDDIVEQARRIGQRNLASRLPHPGAPDEIGRLVDTLNDMLDRLERGIEAQRNFTADASHELRSPLSRLRAELEIALRRPRDAASYVETLRSALDEVESLTLLVEELLVLARLDAGQERGEMESLPLHDLVRETLRRMAPVARQRQVALTVDEGAPLTAVSARVPVQLALTNLLDNAIKYSPQGGAVNVRLMADAAAREAVVRVTDEGPGIEASDMPHLFERFYRGARAREAASGLGLGLSLAQAVMHAHGARLEATNAPGGGACFDLRLPMAVG